MTTMIEKAARAMIDARAAYFGVAVEDTPERRDLFAAYVRAVLQAIREPTEVMLASGAAIIADRFEQPSDWLTQEIAERVHAAMIDAALKE